MDNATRKELLYRARAAGYPGSILDVYANYDQGKDIIAEFQDQQRHQQMSQMAAQQSGLQQGGQQPQMDMQPQPVAMPAIPSSPTPSPNFTPPQPPAPIGVQSQDTPVGIVSGQSGPNQGRAIFATGGFTEQDPPDWRTILNYRNATTPTPQNLVGDVRKVARPTAVAESTNRNVTQKIPANTKELKAEKDAQAAYDALPEAMKHQDVVYADRGSDSQKAINQIYYALSNPVEAAGHAMKYGYVPQGNVGNYGVRQDGDAFSDTVNSFANPFAWGNAAYRFANDVTNKDSYTTGMGALNMGADLAESLPFFGAAAKTMDPAVKSFASHPLVNGLHDVAADSKLYGPVYVQALASKAANSLTSPLGIPLYKLPGINKAYKGAAYAVGKQSGMQSRSIKQVKRAILGKDPEGAYTGGDFSPTGQNALRQYIFGDASNFESSSIPQRGLTKYTKKYGPLDNFKLKMSIPDHANMKFFDIAPNEYSTDKWAHLNPELSHLDEMTTHSPEDLLKVQKALEKVIQKKGTLPISMKAPTGYTDTDIAGHTMFLTHDPATGEISSHIQDIWKFTPEEYAKKWTIVGNPEGKLAKTQDLNQYKIYQQAKLMEKAGKPFVTHDVRPFEIFPQFRGKPSGVPEVFHLADDVDPNDVGFKTNINLKKSKKLGGPVCYTCVGRKRRV